MSGIRKAIAKAMVNSKHTAPHVTLLDEIDVTELVAHRKKFKAIAAEKDIKLTYLPYVVKALVSTLREFPQLNTSLDDEKEEIPFDRTEAPAAAQESVSSGSSSNLGVPNVQRTRSRAMSATSSLHRTLTYEGNPFDLDRVHTKESFKN